MINFEFNNSYTVNVPPIALMKDAINIGGGSADLKIDLTNLAPEHHQLAILCVMRNFPVNIVIPSGDTFEPEKPKENLVTKIKRWKTNLFKHDN